MNYQDFAGLMQLVGLMKNPVKRLEILQHMNEYPSVLNENQLYIWEQVKAVTEIEIKAKQGAAR